MKKIEERVSERVAVILMIIALLVGVWIGYLVCDTRYRLSTPGPEPAPAMEESQKETNLKIYIRSSYVRYGMTDEVYFKVIFNDQFISFYRFDPVHDGLLIDIAAMNTGLKFIEVVKIYRSSDYAVQIGDVEEGYIKIAIYEEYYDSKFARHILQQSIEIAGDEEDEWGWELIFDQTYLEVERHHIDRASRAWFHAVVSSDYD